MPVNVKKFPYGALTFGGTMKMDKISRSLAWTRTIQEVAKNARKPSKNEAIVVVSWFNESNEAA